MLLMFRKFLSPASACRALKLQGCLAIALCIATAPALAFETDPGDIDPNSCLGQLEQAAISFWATSTNVEPGQSTTLNWGVAVPSRCGNGLLLDVNGQHVATLGALAVNVPSTQVYALSATYVGTRVTLASVTVTAEYPLPSGSVVQINGSSPAHRDLLKRALEASGKRVELAPNVDIDMTGMTVTLAPGTTLTGNGARSATNLGPRLRTSDRPRPLLLIRCFEGWNPEVNVTLEGFRLQGPHWNPVAGDDNLEKGIMVESCRKVSISNMEISGWSGQGIYVADELGQIDFPEDVKIFENYFHHNQHEDGNGYGVESTHGARVLIERNVFDFNRHAIAAGGGYEPGAGYIARHNLVLKGGGYHRSETWPHTDWQTHQFDVHGTTACGPFVLNAEYSCGEAGVYFEFFDNAIQYSRANSFPIPDPGAIKIRGNPLVSPVATRNVFAYDNQGSAIKQNGWEYESQITSPIITNANRYGYDSFSRYGVCDLDGNGIDDLFLATGANWWWSSGGKMHWKFLRAAKETLDEVGLGDFDGDSKCDVVSGGSPYPLKIAKSGFEEWKVLVDRTGASTTIPFSRIRFGDFNGDRRTDVFHSDSSGQWRIASLGVAGAPGVYDWTTIQNSGIDIKNLRFGFFNDDRVTDVLAVQGGKWSVSYSGRSSWTELNRIRGENLQSMMIADINNNGIDDIMRYRWLRNQAPLPGGAFGGDMGIWEVTWDGRGTNWIRLHTFSAPTGHLAPLTVPAFVGRFDERISARKLLTIPSQDRIGRVYDIATGQFIEHSMYAY